MVSWLFEREPGNIALALVSSDMGASQFLYVFV